MSIFRLKIKALFIHRQKSFMNKQLCNFETDGIIEYLVSL